jgi:hypothetical protein
MSLIDPFLGSDRETNNETTFSARKRLGQHVPAATDTHKTIEKLSETGISAVLRKHYYRKSSVEKISGRGSQGA